MDSSSSNDASASQQTISINTITVEEIIKKIPTLIDQLSKVKKTLLLQTSTNSDANNTQDNSGINVHTSHHGNNSGSNNCSTRSEKGKDKDESRNTGNNINCWGSGFCNSEIENVVKDQDGTNSNSNNSNNGDSCNAEHVQLQLHKQLEKLERDLNFIKSAFVSLKDLEDFVSIHFMNLKLQSQNLDNICTSVAQMNIGRFPTKQLQSKIRLLNEMIMKLKLQLPLPHKISAVNRETFRPETGNDFNSRNVIDELLKLHENKSFNCCPAFKVFQESFDQLDVGCKLCLLCFAVFPENAIVKKRLLTYWWIGEGFVEPAVDDEEQTAEKIAEGVLKKFIVKGFIDPEIKKLKLVGFRMHPFIRYMVISLAAKMGFLDFDSMGNPTANFSLCQRACLVNTEQGSSRKMLMNTPEVNLGKLNLEKLQTLFNVNDPYPDFKLEWFLRMKNINVLCLGRWQSSAMHHIEVEDTEFLRGLKNMKHLKFLSLQGISRISELPDSICNLKNLRILDLSACHNLDRLPDNIGQLKILTHLDISECYLPNHIPKGIGMLSELEVLKGFVLSDVKIRSACTLDDLAKLGKLRKLSIHTSKKDFPNKEELTALHRLVALRKLTISWAGKSAQDYDAVKSTKVDTGNAKHHRDGRTKDNGGAERATNPVSKKLTRAPAVKRDTRLMRPEPPIDLEKLDLRCFPGTGAPHWLMPHKLKLLNKLYIRGGNLHNLGQAQEQNKWTVKILRLKFLDELNMDWRELRRSFPDLIYLEKVRCPKLTLFPCEERGVWLNRTVISKQSLEREVEFTWSFLAGRPT